MSEINEIVLCLRKKGVIVDRGAIEFIEDKGLSIDDFSDFRCDSLFLTRNIAEEHFNRLKRMKNDMPGADKSGSAKPGNDSALAGESRVNEGREHRAIVNEHEDDPSRDVKKTHIQPADDEDEDFSGTEDDRCAKDIGHSVDIEEHDGFDPRERSTESFVEYFNARYNTMKNLLSRRPELKNLMSIGRIGKFSSDRDVSIIGLVSGISQSKNGNTILDIEDPTGNIKVLVKKEKEDDEIDILQDEVLGFFGSTSNGFFFADTVVSPDVPFPSGIRKVNDPVWAVFLSDLHFGSKFFNKGIEERFIKWIHSPDARFVKYIFVAGDTVDGIGIYPAQKSDLLVKDIYAQYALFEDFLFKIPEHIQIIVCPGNHDAVRLGEPQPKLPRELVPRLYERDNIYLTTNPSYVNIHAVNCEGINVLMYHGYSFTRIVDTVPYLRKHGIQNPQFVMKYVLTKRHLAPTYGATVAIPEKRDPLIIAKIPDILHTGDLHSHAVENYKGITMISSSTFQDQTPFMDRVGHVAKKGIVTIVKLNTRDTMCIDMSGE